MDETVYLLNMFPDYVPPEELREALSQAAIVAADINPENRGVRVAVHAEHYIPQRLMDAAGKDIAELYGLRSLEIAATHPESQLHCMEPEELMWLFVSRDSMTRGTLAGAKWSWEGTELHIQLRANGKKALEELIPQVQTALREKFACPVTVQVHAGQDLSGQALFDAMESMRGTVLESLPAVSAKQEQREKPQMAPSDTFYGKPFKGIPVPMRDLNLDMGTIIVEGKVFAVDHKELKKRNAWVVKFDITDNTNSIRVTKFMEAGEAKPILDNVSVGKVLRV